MLYNQTKTVTITSALTAISMLSKGFGFFGIGELNGGHNLILDAQFDLREVGANWALKLREKNRNVDLFEADIPGAAQGMLRLRLELNCLVSDENGNIRITGEAKYPKAGGGFAVVTLPYEDVGIDTLSAFEFDLKMSADDNDAQADCVGLMLQWAATGQQV